MLIAKVEPDVLLDDVIALGRPPKGEFDGDWEAISGGGGETVDPERGGTEVVEAVLGASGAVDEAVGCLEGKEIFVLRVERYVEFDETIEEDRLLTDVDSNRVADEGRMTCLLIDHRLRGD
jgi:hypothetical protein